jgi:hypothetical protein
MICLRNRAAAIGTFDSGANTLIQITAGVRSEIGTGAQYEMQKKEDELTQQWSAIGFERTGCI